MIPVSKDNYEVISLNRYNLSKEESKYQELLKNQIEWLNKNYIQVKKSSMLLYQKYKK